MTAARVRGAASSLEKQEKPVQLPILRRMGAILSVTVPATIRRSAWRGENRTTSEPKRAMS